MHTEDPCRKQGIELLCIMQQLCVCPSTIVLQVSFRLKAIGGYHYMHSVIILVVSYGEDDKVSHLITVYGLTTREVDSTPLMSKVSTCVLIERETC